MNKPELEKLAFDNPNDFELGGKIREITNELPNEPEDDYKNQYLRLAADFDNFRKRMAREKEDTILKVKTSMIEPILDLDSDISLASKKINDEGINLIVSKLDKFLKSQGIETIQTDTYDPDVHEVISMVDSNKKGIVDVISKGYKIGNKIIRYPKVIITKG
jgi:molecular chaperone GrpE